MRLSTALLTQQRQLDQLIGALEGERFVPQVLLHQLTSELSEHLRLFETTNGTGARYTRALRQAIAALLRVRPESPEFTPRVRELHRVFHHHVCLVQAGATPGPSGRRDPHAR